MTRMPEGVRPAAGRGDVAQPSVEPHRFRCQLRWADVDSLGHVNNVAYADYLQEAHRSMLTNDPYAWAVADRGGVRRQELTYLAPMVPSAESEVVIESRLTGCGDELAIDSEVIGVTGGDRTVTARSKALLGRPAEPARGQAVRPDHAHQYAAAVRFSDLDVNGIVGDTSYFVYLQEARIALMADLGLDPTSTVVAQKNVDFLRHDLDQPTTFEVWTWVSRVGNRSVTFESSVSHGDVAFAHGSSTLVFFDLEAQRSTMPPASVTAALRSLTIS